MHEERSFNEVIFVNHSTSQTWSLPENEQFCIKWSISVNGEGLTSLGSSESLVKWNHWVVFGLEDDVSITGVYSTLLCSKCKTKRNFTFDLQKYNFSKVG